MNTNLSGHGTPNGSLPVQFAGQLYVDVDTSNLFSGAGGTSWTIVIQVAGPSAPFSGLVTPDISVPAGSNAVAWVVIALTDLATYLEWGILKPLNTQDLQPGQADRFTSASIDIANELRSAIASYTFGYVLSATPNSVPPELKRCACYMTILAMYAACPAMILDSDKRKSFEKLIDSTLKGLSSGSIRPSMPPDAAVSTVQAFPAAEVTIGHYAEVNHWSMRGI